MTYFDFNSASEQTSFDLIPKGTLVRVRMTIRPGGFDDASQGWTGGYANRGDGKGLRAVFSNVADQITLGEMISAGHLVPPRTFVIDVGVQDALRHVRRTAMDFDMDEVASILDKRLITEAVIKHWKANASSRKTIVFCSTVPARDQAGYRANRRAQR